ncbi:hypothetical protein MKX01_020106 [Papaver californicum]|nr:hypothetical protein MKX01_020106 [Papaver californicum]
MRGFGGPLLSLVLIMLFSLLQKPTLAVKPGKKSYIVYMGAHSHGAKVTSADLDKVTDAHCQLLSTVVGSQKKAKESMFYSYRRYINGFAAVLDQQEAEEISKSESGEVSSLSAWNVRRYGEDTIIANLDTGVWPESKSFSDEGMGPIPSRWKGTCQNNTKDGVPCNKKLIGARYFINGYAAGVYSNEIPANLSARDYDGHGTHTLSTAGGNFVSGANVFGLGKGTAKGGSPKSRVAAYKVCWKPINDSGCYDADILAAFEAAIHDGVDIISASIGGPPADYFTDGIAIGSFHAVKHGITVVTSAGNNGAVEGGVSNTAPLTQLIGCSLLELDLATGSTSRYGESLYPKALPIKKFYPLINGASAKAVNSTDEDAQLCFAGSLDPAKVRGKILACLRGITGRVEKGIVALQAGAVGMILANDEANGYETVADPHVLPSAHITYSDGLAMFSYIDSTKSPGAIMTRARTQYGVNPVPAVAAFSSRGPNVVTPEILKPDVTAPGVGIIAAFTQAIGPAGETDDRRVLFNTESGTSMSCPHIAGVAALLKTVHPDWSPSAIKSAIMTTARTQDSQKVAMRNSSNLQATPSNYGSGQVRPNAVMDPGLVYDVTTNDYLNFFCGLGYDESQLKPFTAGMPYECPESYSLTDFDYPSVTVPDLYGSITVTRTVKNVGSPGTYKAQIHAPRWIRVSVEPKTLTFQKIGEEKMFKVTLKAVHSSDQYTFGRLTWTDGVHFVRSTIVVRAVPASL